MTDEISPEVLERIDKALSENGTLEAVKIHREATGSSLKNAKAFVDARRDGRPVVSNSGGLDQGTVDAITEALAAGQKIQAIKLYRDATGKGLREAKEFVEALLARLRQEDPDRFAQSAGGCGAAILILAAGTGLVALMLQFAI